MRGGVRKRLESWLEAARKIGFLILLLAGSAAFGFAIAWPLWLFATSQRQAYTIFAFCLAGGGLLALAVRRFIRRRGTPRDQGKPRRTILSVLLTILLTIVALAGGYLAAVLLYRGLWILGHPDARRVGGAAVGPRIRAPRFEQTQGAADSCRK